MSFASGDGIVIQNTYKEFSNKSLKRNFKVNIKIAPGRTLDYTAQKLKFSVKDVLVTVTKSAVSGGFDHIY